MGDAMNESERAFELLTLAIDAAQEIGLTEQEFMSATLETWALVNEEWVNGRA